MPALFFSNGAQGDAAITGSPLLSILLGTLDSISQYAVNLDAAAVQNFRNHLGCIRERLAAISEPTLADSTQGVSSDIRNCVRDYRDHISLFVERLRRDLRSTSEALHELLGSMQEGGHADHELEDELRDLEKLMDCCTLEEIRAGLVHSTQNLRVYAERIRSEKDVLITQLKSEIDCLHRSLERAELASNADPITGVCRKSDFVRFLRRQLIAGEPTAVIQIRLGLPDTLADEVVNEVLMAFVRRLRNVISPNALVGAGAANTYYVMLQKGGDTIGDRITNSCGGRYVYLRGGVTCTVLVQAAVTSFSRAINEELDTFIQRLNLE